MKNELINFVLDKCTKETIQDLKPNTNLIDELT